MGPAPCTAWTRSSSSPTATGKTLAYLIPLAQGLLEKHVEKCPRNEGPPHLE